MALIRPSEDEGTAAESLEMAERHFQDALEALDIAKRHLQDGADPRAAEIARAASDLRKATQTLFDERKKVEQQRRRDARIDADFGFDFDDARTEIGRRLDRLRDTLGSGGVS